MPDRRRYARSPDTLAILSLAVLAGLVQILSHSYPGSVLAMVSTTWASVWAWSLVGTAGLCIAGILIRDDLDGWVLELSGRIGLSLTMAAYTFALWAGSSDRLGAALVLGFTAGIAASSAWRVWQLTRRLGQWRSALHRTKGRIS